MAQELVLSRYFYDVKTYNSIAILVKMMMVLLPFDGPTCS